MLNGLALEKRYIILRNFQDCLDWNGKWPLQNLKKIGLELTVKSLKIMRSWLI